MSKKIDELKNLIEKTWSGNYLKGMFTMQTGGNVYVDYLVLNNGQTLTITPDLLALRTTPDSLSNGELTTDNEEDALDMLDEEGISYIDLPIVEEDPDKEPMTGTSLIDDIDLDSYPKKDVFIMTNGVVISLGSGHVEVWKSREDFDDITPYGDTTLPLK